jgi:hypothetical protein
LRTQTAEVVSFVEFAKKTRLTVVEEYTIHNFNLDIVVGEIQEDIARLDVSMWDFRFMQDRDTVQ